MRNKPWFHRQLIKSKPSSSVRTCRHITALVLLAAGLLADPTTNLADTIFVANTYDSTIQKFTSRGVGSVFAGVPYDYSHGLRQPYGLTFDSTGNLYVGNFGFNSIEKFTPNGVDSAFTGPSLDGVMGLAIDTAGNIYAASYYDSSIVKFTPGGTRSVFASSGLGFPTGLAFDDAGNLYAANMDGSGHSWIEKFTPNGVGTLFAACPDGAGPWGLAFDRTGNLYTSYFYNNTVVRFTPDGVGSTVADTLLSSPAGLAFDSMGDLYVANYGFISGYNTITKFTPGGERSIFAYTGLNRPTFIAIIPEPSSAALLGIASFALLAWGAQNNSARVRNRGCLPAEQARCSKPGDDALVGNRGPVAPGR